MQQKKNTILTTSTANGRAAHTIPTLMKRITVLLALIVSFAFGARAQSVIMSGDYFLTHNVEGTSVIATGTTTFNPATCLWQFAQNDYIRPADNNGSAITSNNNYLQYTSLTLGNNGFDWYSARYNQNIYHRTGNSSYNRTYYYLRLNGTNWQISNNNSNNGKLIQVTITNNIPLTITNPTINGNDVLTATGNYTYTASGAVYQAGGYSNYRFNNTDHYFDNNTAIKAATLSGTAWSISTNEYATINSSTGVVTVNSIPTSDVTLTITATVDVTGGTGTPAAPAGVTLVGTKEITIQGSVPAAPTISVSGTTVTLQTDATGTTSIRYTIDGTDPTATTGTVYSGAFDISGSTNSPVTIKAITVRNGNASSVTTQQAKLTLPEPVITVNAASGTATITCSNSSATIYYTTDGSAPSATNDTRYNGQITGLTPMTTVKAIAICDGWNSSSVASATVTIPSGVSSDGTTVTLFDYEDHNWSYYQQSENLPSGYPTTYLSSPNPRNIKITYRGGGINDASAVAISALEGEGQNEMVYYKTLEKSVPGMSGDYPYTVISNPFSKRPATGSGNNKTYYGFAGWKVVDGGEYISEHNDNDVLDLDETIHFTNLDNNYTPNCMSAEIVFEATWTQATVKTGSSAQSFDGGSYETNFWVLSGNNNIGNITVPGNCTVSSRYPDGTVNFTRNLTGTITAGGNNAKVEFVNMNSTGNVSAANYTFTMGRGIVNSGNGGELRGCTNSNADCIQTVKVESGKYASLHHFTAGLSDVRRCDQLMILGCDYDRAKIDNSKLQITGSMYLAYSTTINRASGVLFARSNIKSGTFQKTITGDYSGTAAQSYYFGCYGSNNRSAGHRYMLVEGGDIRGLCGGTDHTTNQQAGDPAFTLRIRGSENNPIINGIIYGAAENADCQGRRTMVLTGGTVKGWIAGGANGTEQSGGTMTGATFVYVGGKANINSSGSQTVINRAVGGNVFAAGCGNGINSSSGQVTQGTNVVVADDAYVERGVYGGGSYGYTTNTSNIYITGGRIGGVAGGVNGTSYSANIPGGVYGGACQNQGGTVNIYMTGGEVNGGLYGGSNNSGTIANNVTMQINGGQVGTSSAPANIHGGGYGQATRVSGDVEVTLGTEKQATGGVTVYGDVYGGSALGYVNGTTATDTYHTHVTMNKGTIYGSLYGGALGSNTVPANVYGPVEVKVYGGSVKATSAAGSGGVYGANNINGAPQRSVTVDIYGTDPAPEENQYALHAVYGGGNQAPYTYGNGYPKVTVHYCDNSIEYVYGGGNAAAVAATDVTIYGGDVIGNVFGGGNGTVSAANVTGSTSTKIYGGTILNVYGGSNSQGTIGGDINLLVNSQAEEGKDLCLMNIVNVFGGGNQAASKAGNISIVCTGDKGYIENVYGGANQANIEGNIDLHINGGNIGNVFGGNNESGNISGSITVTVGNAPNEDCGIFEIGNVYGGGNLAAYSNGNGYPIVNMLGGTVREAIFGGGYGESAIVTGNPKVNVSGGIVGSVITIDGTQTILGDIYGGGNMAPLIGNPVVTLSDKANVWSRVFGGGNNALVTGNTNVTMSGGVVGFTEKVGERDVVRGGDIFGGGNAATIEGETNVRITNGRIGHNVYGGGNEGNVTGKTNVKVGE